MNVKVKKALERFDKAAQEYAFRGTYSGSTRYGDVIEEYRIAKEELTKAIDWSTERAFKNGQAAIQSRVDFPDTVGR